jgi:hypothetical protein
MDPDTTQEADVPPTLTAQQSVTVTGEAKPNSSASSAAQLAVASPAAPDQEPVTEP